MADEQPGFIQSLADIANVALPGMVGAYGAPNVPGGRSLGAIAGIGAGAEAEQALAAQKVKQQQAQAELDYKKQLGAHVEQETEALTASNKRIDLIAKNADAYIAAHPSMSEQDKMLLQSDPEKWAAETKQDAGKDSLRKTIEMTSHGSIKADSIPVGLDMQSLHAILENQLKGKKYVTMDGGAFNPKLKGIDVLAEDTPQGLSLAQIAGRPPAGPKADAAPDGSYETKLTPDEERRFQQWKKLYAPNDSGVDYDLRGAFKAGSRPGANGHGTDQFKKPNHPTFSNESQYAVGADAAKAGHWLDGQFVPPAGTVLSAERRAAISRAGDKVHELEGPPRTATSRQASPDAEGEEKPSGIPYAPAKKGDKENVIVKRDFNRQTGRYEDFARDKATGKELWRHDAGDQPMTQTERQALRFESVAVSQAEQLVDNLKGLTDYTPAKMIREAWKYNHPATAGVAGQVTGGLVGGFDPKYVEVFTNSGQLEAMLRNAYFGTRVDAATYTRLTKHLPHPEAGEPMEIVAEKLGALLSDKGAMKEMAEVIQGERKYYGQAIAADAGKPDPKTGGTGASGDWKYLGPVK